MYSVNFTSRAARIFKKFEDPLKREFGKHIEYLNDHPMNGEPLQGAFKGLRSIHFTFKGVAYRLIYSVNIRSEQILIYLADKRENIYKRLEEVGF
jgi:mRNA-degrading endonuclease RelE of RelBE toxin-antitoxin system